MSMYAAMAVKGLGTPIERLASLPREFSTPGGISERCHAHLLQLSRFDEFASGLEAMRDHLNKLRAES